MQRRAASAALPVAMAVQALLGCGGHETPNDGAVLYSVSVDKLSGAFHSVTVASLDDADDDADDDGVGDYLIGLPTFGRTQTGVVRVLSGVDGRTLWRYEGQEPGDSVGRAIASIGDVDGDGIRDFAFSSRTQGTTTVSTRALTVLEARRPAWDGSDSVRSISWCSDLNGDGADEILVGLVHPDGRSVEVVSGRTGDTIRVIKDVYWTGWTEENEIAWHNWSISVSGVEDYNQDGFEDVLVGFGPPLFGYGSRPTVSLGVVAVYSGQTGEVLRVQDARQEERFGDSVARMGDIDGDGVGDYVVGSSSSLLLYSGARGILVDVVRLQGRRWVLDAGGLLRRESPTDVLALSEIGGNGRPLSAAAKLEFVSGTDSKHLGSMWLGACSSFEGRACFVDDIDSDGHAEVLVAVPGAGAGTRVDVLSGSSILRGEPSVLNPR